MVVESEHADLLRLLVESVRDYAIFMLDTDGRIASWNLGARRIKGYEAEEIIGRHFSVFYPAADVAGGKCERGLETARREGRFEDEGWRLRKDGTRFWANVVISAVHDGSGKLVGYGKVTRDLTARLENEEERVRLARAEEGERRRDEFLSVIGHELRNPMAPIATAFHIIKERKGIGCDKEIAVIERQMTQLTRLLDDLRDVSRTLLDRIEVAPTPMELRDILAPAVEASAPIFAEKDQRFHVEIAADLRASVDRARMTQVFTNLLNNASKYTPPGGAVTLRAADEGAYVAIAIEDDGIGIAPDVLPQIFDMFARAPEARRGVGGFGIGLAVAQRLVKAHGGTLTAESAGIDRGSRFVVRIPRSTLITTTDAREDAVAPGPSRGRQRVLLVDDNEDAVDMFRAYLEHMGHEVHVAFDGPRGLELADRVRPSIAFLDLALPIMDGFELVRRMRKLPTCATIPIIAVSGYARDADRQAATRAGFSGHFAKPFALNELEGVLRTGEGIS